MTVAYISPTFSQSRSPDIPLNLYVTNRSNRISDSLLAPESIKSAQKRALKPFIFLLEAFLYLVFVQEEVSGLEVTVDDLVLVEIIHAFRHIDSHSQQHGHFQESLLLAQVIVHAPTRHVLCDDTQVGRYGARTDELHHVLMPHLPHYEYFLLKLSLQVLV